MVLTLQFLAAVTGKGSDALFFPLVFLHAVAALTGFGSIGFAGTYASRAAHLSLTSAPRPDRPGATRAPEGLPAEGVPAEGVLSGVAPSDGPPSAGTTPHGVPLDGPRSRGIAALLPQASPLLDGLAGGTSVRPARVSRPIPTAGGLDQVWVIGGLLVWLSATLVALSMVVPALREMRAVLLRARTLPEGVYVVASDRARLLRAGVLASRARSVCDLLFFAALALMIWRP